MRFLYTIAIHLYSLGVRLAAFFGHAKAKLWVEGRRIKAPEPVEGPTEQWLWFHAASLGEFEQGRPLIEALKERHPQCKVLLSFFSPSGYEVRKDYPLADEVLYLPIDTPQNAAAWVRRHHFVAAFFIKYEFWFNYMQALKEAGIPLFYISLILKEKSFFFKPYGKWFRKQMRCVTHFFVQDDATSKLLAANGLDNFTVCGDTRFDRVAAIARQAKAFPEIERFIEDRKCIIAGSTWPPDERLLAAFLPQLPTGYCLILAPHDISESHVSQIRAMFPEAQLYTDLCSDESRPLSLPKGGQSNIMVVNTIGILSQLYQYARFVYIGGGFGVNIHNIQEPVTFGCPVIFGPKYTDFKEAVDLVALGGAFTVTDAESLIQVFLRLMGDDGHCENASAICRDYLESQLGATETIMKKLSQFRFLP